MSDRKKFHVTRIIDVGDEIIDGESEDISLPFSTATTAPGYEGRTIEDHLICCGSSAVSADVPICNVIPSSCEMGR